jgi:hypothetical protein
MESNGADLTGEMKMDKETRELYAAIGRGETVQLRLSSAQDWSDWDDESTVYALGSVYMQWRIKPKTRTAIIDGVTYEWPEPMKKEGEGYYVGFDGSVSDSMKIWLELANSGRFFATREGAEAFACAEKALRGVK